MDVAGGLVTVVMEVVVGADVMVVETVVVKVDVLVMGGTELVTVRVDVVPRPP